MTDKNGVEILTGHIVRITGAYFKNDNGLYLVDRSPGDPSWFGRDHSLIHISPKGKISTAKYRIGFWPIMVTTNSRAKYAEAKKWNAEHAQIEVVSIKDTTEIEEHFRASAAGYAKRYHDYALRFGDECQEAVRSKAVMELCKAVADRIAVEQAQAKAPA